MAKLEFFPIWTAGLSPYYDLLHWCETIFSEKRACCLTNLYPPVPVSIVLLVGQFIFLAISVPLNRVSAFFFITATYKTIPHIKLLKKVQISGLIPEF